MLRPRTLTQLAAVLTVAMLVARSGGEDAKPPEIAKPAPNKADEPLAKEASLAKSAEFLDAVSLSWTRERKCGTCHTNYPYLMARPALKDVPSPAHDEVRKFFEERVAHWEDKDSTRIRDLAVSSVCLTGASGGSLFAAGAAFPGRTDDPKARPRWDAEVVATASLLAFNDAQTTGKLHPMTRKALDKMWTVQKPNGGWTWLKCNWPPFEHDDYYGAVLAAVGVSVAPDGYSQGDSAKEGLAKLRAYFAKTPAPDLHHKAWLLWASIKLDGLMSKEEHEKTLKDLLALQREDGGWSLPSLGDWKGNSGRENDKNAPSDGYGTGLVVYILRQAGLPADHERIQKGVKWLKSNQRESGRWFTRSLNTERAHYITNAGTSFAVLALRACETVK
jgi:squalene-hopene/tetraprenyl-beta-curcumene cyclase